MLKNTEHITILEHGEAYQGVTRIIPFFKKEVKNSHYMKSISEIKMNSICF